MRELGKSCPGMGQELVKEKKLCVRRRGNVSVPFALEHRQPKGAVLAVGFLRMGRQTLYFPYIAISKSDNSSEGFLRT